MDANTSNFQKFIIRKITRSIDYDVSTDQYSYNQSEMSDDILNSVIKEGERYGMSASDARHFLTVTASNIKVSPSVDKQTTSLDISQISFGQHIRIEFKHPQNGQQWIECIKLKESLFVLNSSIRGIFIGVRLYPQTSLWSVGYSIDCSYQERHKPSPKKNVFFCINELTSVLIYTPSFIYEIIDSQNSFCKEEQQKESKKKKLALTQRESDFLSIVDSINNSITKDNIIEDYPILKSRILDIQLSSYILNILIKATKAYYTTLPKDINDNYDDTFFRLTKNPQSDMSHLDQALTHTQEEIKKNRKIWKKKERRLKFHISFLYIIIIVFSWLFLVSYGELSQTNKENETKIKQTTQQLESAKVNIKKLCSYKHSLGATTQRWLKYDDNSWILWVHAKEKVVIESCCIRGQEGGNVKIGIYDEQDKSVKELSTYVSSDKFMRLNINAKLDTGYYYMRIKSGVSLQYHNSNDMEYEQFCGDALELTGCCHFDDRKDSKMKHKHNYYQYFYNFKYHIYTE